MTIRKTVLFLAFSAVFIRGFEIVKNKAGYEGVVVAIHRDVEESNELVESIKDLFTNGSSFLFKSTGERAYFKSVTIVLPMTWTENSITNKPVFGEYFEDAHIRVASPNPEYGNAPYTLQPGECGDSGLYIHYTPDFLLNVNGSTNENFGELGRNLVHEWAHFRYGVFDEYGVPGDSRFPVFYMEKDKIYPNSCIKGIEGSAETNEKKGRCTIYDGGLIGDDCHFIPALPANNRASIMYMPYNLPTEGFCNETGQGKEHNWSARSKQNYFCGFKSTWEIIFRHKDFQGEKGSQVSNKTDTTPTFRVVRIASPDDRRTVLLMDTSGSMDEGRMKKLQSSSTRLLLDFIPWNTSISLVEFNSNVNVSMGMTRVTSQEVRQQLVEALPKKSVSRTSIGGGLKMAVEILEEDGKSAEGTMIILISDGDENEDPRIPEVWDMVLKSGVIVNTVAIGLNASESLEELVTVTGGKGFFFSDRNDTISSLDAAFEESFTSQGDVELQQVTLKDGHENLDANQGLSQTIHIDKELGKNTVFYITSKGKIAFVEINLLSPSNKLYNETSTGVYEEDLITRNRKQFTFPNAENGAWSINYTSTIDTDVYFKMTSEPVDPKKQPIRAKCWFGSVELVYPSQAKIYAQVTKGYKAVISATVKAIVEKPNGESVEILLEDNGAGADSMKDDGIYTRYFTDLTVGGRYTAVAIVSNDGKARLKQGTPGSAAPAIPKNARNPEENPVIKSSFDISFFIPGNEPPVKPVHFEPAGDFSRNANAGSFRISNVPAILKDITKPNRVTDLKIEHIDFKAKTAVLTWTAPGDDMDSGTPASIDIRFADNVEDITFRFDDQSFNATINDPQSAGTFSEYNITLNDFSVDENATDLYFAIRATDKASNKADISNIVSLHYSYIAPGTESAPKSNANVGVIVGSIAGAFGFTGVLVGVILSLYIKRDKNVKRTAL